MIRTLTRTVAAAASVAALGGCALLSSPEPVSLHRFGAAPDSEIGAAGAPAGQVQVAMRRPEFVQAARDDRILGVTGTDAAYIAGARWVASADVLFSDALEDAFAAEARRVRLIGPRELTRAEQTLDVDVRTFEARYPAPGAIPTATIVARVRLLNAQERTVAADRIFAVEQPATANRVSAIVEAFDAATRDLNSQIVAWTDQNAR
ncbi:ABC-type transport auxiliary lipoprotein family protein [Brevundimonas sp.]|uniref:ABC-type transport auxiliary lipoprotein family protein n=1 Tax=Brevundimonas sp. TaxID=1871086 RepID=UPI0035B2ACB4